MTDNYNNIGTGQGMDLSALASQAQGNFAQAQNNAINTISNFSTVQSKGGKSYWMGMELSPEMALLMTQATSSLPAFFNDSVNGGVYRHASGLYNKIYKQATGKENLKGGHKAGIRTAAGVMGLLIGIQPTIGVVQALKNRSEARRDIRKNIESIIETNNNYEDNEVIKTAMERTQRIMISGFKDASAQLPMVLASGWFALGNHKAMVHDKNREFTGRLKRASATAVNAQEDFIAKRVSDDNKFREAAERSGIKESDPLFENMQREWREIKAAEHEIAEEKKSGKFQVDAKTQNFVNMGALVGNVFMQRAVSKDNKEEFSKPTAYNLIMNLQNAVNNGEVPEGSNITQHIIEIFQQNEIDRGRSKIGDALLNKFQPLAEMIGNEISEQRLDAIALVNLVGEGKIINKRRFIDEEHLENLIDIQKKVFGSHEKTSLDDWLADFKSPNMIMKAVKENLKNLQGDEKALFASLFSDDVLIRSGVNKKDILPLRERGYELTRNFVVNTAIELSQKEPEELVKMGLSSAQIEGINSLNQLLEEGKAKEAKALIADIKNGNVTPAVRDYMLLKQAEGSDGKKLWTEAVKAAHKKPVTPTPKKPVISKEEMPDMSAVERLNAGRNENAGVPLGGLA